MTSNRNTANNETLRMPPRDLMAEQSVLGGLMIELEKVDDIAPLIRSEDFYLEPHQIVFTCILAMRDAGKPVNTISVADELHRLGKLDRIGGALFLAELTGAMPPYGSANIAYDAKLIREASQRRGVIDATRDLQTAAYDHRDVADLHAMFDGAQRRIFERDESRGCLSMCDVLHKRRELLAQNDPGGVSTGWPDVDEGLGGVMRPGSLVIIGARPGVGKTATALCIALAAAQQKLATLFVTLEQNEVDIANRLLSALSGLSFADCERDRLTDSLDRERLADAENQLADLPLKIKDESSLRLSQIIAAARAERRHGLGLLIVDYLGLVRPDTDDRVNREQQVATITRGLKRLARDLDAVVICLAQLNREIESRDRKQPRLSDLRDSGQIEADADLVMFLDRPATYDPDAHPSEASIIIAKNRNGPCGKVPLIWSGSTMTYRSAARSWESCAFANVG